MLTFTLTLEHSWSIRLSCPLGAEHSCTQGRRNFLKTLLHQLPKKDYFHVMFAGPQHTMEQKELNTRKRKGQDATKKTSAFADSCIQFLWSMMPIPTTARTWIVKNTPNRNTIEKFTEEIDEAGFVRQYYFFYLVRMLCLCLAIMYFAQCCAPFF